MGLLNHACKRVMAGRSFLRWMIDSRHQNSASRGPPICISSGLGMVEVIRIHLERLFIPTSPSPAPGAPGHLRCIRPVGLWGMVWREMFPGGIPPLHSPSLSRSCYPSCWLGSGMACHRQWSHVCTPALASTRESCTCCFPDFTSYPATLTHALNRDINVHNALDVILYILDKSVSSYVLCTFHHGNSLCDYSRSTSYRW